MTDKEFDVLDELYFVTPYKELALGCKLDDNELREVLMSLFLKKFLRVYEEPDVELEQDQVDFEQQFKQYYYLASKEGLLAHNTA
ncbi:MAG: hypothetical protein JXQ90_19815 [Cyclobacteriaceae bacterium]